MPSQLMHLGPSGQERPVFQDIDAELFDLTLLTDEIDGKSLAADGAARALDAATAGLLPRMDATGLRVGPPVLRPGAVICIGMNYAAHASRIRRHRTCYPGRLPPTEISVAPRDATNPGEPRFIVVTLPDP